MNLKLTAHKNKSLKSSGQFDQQLIEYGFNRKMRKKVQ